MRAQDRGSGEADRGFRADPSPVARAVRRHEGRWCEAAEGAREGEPAAEAHRRASGARSRRDARGRPGKLLSPARRRAAVDMLQQRLGMSEWRACRAVGQARSSQRYRPVDADPDWELRAWLREFSGKRPRWGYRRAHVEAARAGHACNIKKIHRLWREEGLRVPPKRRKRRRLGETSIPAQRRTATGPDHVWALDFQLSDAAIY